MTRWELEIAHPPVPVRSLADLHPDEQVWTCTPGWGEPAHRRARRLVAVCGAALCEFPTTVLGVGARSGGLCPDGCWPQETPAGPNPAGDMEGTV